MVPPQDNKTLGTQRLGLVSKSDEQAAPRLTFKAVKSAAPPRSAFSVQKFIDPTSKRLLFVKPRPYASKYFKLLRTVTLARKSYSDSTIAF